MRRGFVAAAVALAAGCLLVGNGSAYATTSARTGGARIAGFDHRSQVVQVTAGDSGVSLSNGVVHAGRVNFRVSTVTKGGSSDVVLFRLNDHVSLKQFFADLAEEFSSKPATAAKGTRDLNRDVRFFGLADVVKGTPTTVTENLNGGRYYVVDLGSMANGSTAQPPVTTLNVVGHAPRHEGLGHVDATILTTSADRFVSPRRLPARGSVLVRNVADTIHFAELQPVKPGTTDADVQKYFDSGAQGPPPFALQGPTVGADVQSPGRELRLSYSLPKGTYVLLCFVADDKTGMPHAVMGMHKVVILH